MTILREDAPDGNSFDILWNGRPNDNLKEAMRQKVEKR